MVAVVIALACAAWYFSALNGTWRDIVACSASPEQVCGGGSDPGACEYLLRACSQTTVEVMVRLLVMAVVACAAVLVWWDGRSPFRSVPIVRTCLVGCLACSVTVYATGGFLAYKTCKNGGECRVGAGDAVQPVAWLLALTLALAWWESR